MKIQIEIMMMEKGEETKIGGGAKWDKIMAFIFLSAPVSPRGAPFRLRFSYNVRASN